MSKVKIVVGNDPRKEKSMNEIPQGTYFTAKIGTLQDRAYFKAYECVVCLKTGDMWDHTTDDLGDIIFTNYRECNVEIKLTAQTKK